MVSIYRYAVSFNRISDFKKPPVTDEDVDVAKERERIYNGGSPSDILQIKDLSKASLSTYSGALWVMLHTTEIMTAFSLSTDIYWNDQASSGQDMCRSVTRRGNQYRHLVFVL